MLNIADFEEERGSTSVRHNCMSTDRYRLVLIRRSITNLDLSMRRIVIHSRPNAPTKNQKVFCKLRYLLLRRGGGAALD